MPRLLVRSFRSFLIIVGAGLILGVSRGRFMSFRLLIVRLMLVVCFALFLLFFFVSGFPACVCLTPMSRLS